MLTTQVELPHEPALNCFEACLDGLAVLEACRAQLLDVDEKSRNSWQEARVVEALYHPKRYLRVVYALTDNPAVPGRRLWPEADLVYLSAPVRQPMSRRGTLLGLGDEKVEAYHFPNDRRLRGLRNFARRDLAMATWQQWMASAQDTRRLDPDSLQRLLVRYVPEQKWVVRLRADLADGPSASNKTLRIAVRSAAPEHCGELLNRHQALSRSSAIDGASFVVPRVVGASVDQGLFAVEWLRGQSLCEALASQPPKEVLRETAIRLHRLHATDVGGLRAQGPPDLQARMNGAIEDLGNAAPELLPSMRAVERRFESVIATIEAAPLVTLHNDFHWNQMSIKGSRFALFDLERMCLGDAYSDVANFATQLQMLGQRPEQGLDVETTLCWRHTFLEQWQQVTGERIDSTRLALHAALSRMDLARGMLRHLRPGWRGLAQTCIEMALEDLTVRGSRGVP